MAFAPPKRKVAGNQAPKKTLAEKLKTIEMRRESWMNNSDTSGQTGHDQRHYKDNTSTSSNVKEGAWSSFRRDSSMNDNLFNQSFPDSNNMQEVSHRRHENQLPDCSGDLECVEEHRMYTANVMDQMHMPHNADTFNRKGSFYKDERDHHSPTTSLPRSETSTSLQPYLIFSTLTQDYNGNNSENLYLNKDEEHGVLTSKIISSDEVKVVQGNHRRAVSLNRGHRLLKNQKASDMSSTTNNGSDSDNEENLVHREKNAAMKEHRSHMNHQQRPNDTPMHGDESHMIHHPFVEDAERVKLSDNFFNNQRLFSGGEEYVQQAKHSQTYNMSDCCILKPKDASASSMANSRHGEMVNFCNFSENQNNVNSMHGLSPKPKYSGKSHSHRSHMQMGPQFSQSAEISFTRPDSHFCSLCKQLMFGTSLTPMFIIPCGHQLCRKCSQIHAQQKCPWCQQGVKCLTVNYMLQTLIDISETQRKFYNVRHSQGQGKDEMVFMNSVGEWSHNLAQLEMQLQKLTYEAVNLRSEIQEKTNEVQRQEKMLREWSEDESRLQAQKREIEQRLSQIQNNSEKYKQSKQVLLSDVQLKQQRIDMLQEYVQNMCGKIDKLKQL